MPTDIVTGRLWVLCPRCETRSITSNAEAGSGRGRRENMRVICSTCSIDEGIRGWLGSPYVPEADWPILPIYGQAIASLRTRP